MKEEFYDAIKVYIVKKLFDLHCWVHKHTSVNNIPKGLPSHARDSKIIKKIVDELIRKEWILAKPTFYGLELSLNIKKKKEIEEFIEKDLNK